MIDANGWIDTSHGFAGPVWVGIEGRQDWVYSRSLRQFLFLPAAHVYSTGGWAYTQNLQALNFSNPNPEHSWHFSTALNNWIFLPKPIEEETDRNSWFFIPLIANSAPVELAPIRIGPHAKADFNETNPEQRYKQAFRISPDDIARFADFDEGIVMSRDENGVTFRSTVTTDTPPAERNRFIRIGYRSGTGLLDFTALAGIAGKIGLDIEGDIDLSETTNGLHVRIKRDSTNVAAFVIHRAGEVANDLLFQPYLNNPSDNAFLEITLPWQGIITLRNIHIYMETEVTGFAGMAERITGGSGSTPANTHTVSNAAEFATALNAVRISDGPSTIYVDGPVTYEDWVAATGNTRREAGIGREVSDLSIVGLGNNALFDGLGIAFQGRNFIIRNVTIRNVLGRDAISINDGRDVIIEHCTLHTEPLTVNFNKDKYDELISVKNNAQNVIVRWNHLYDSHKTILVGSNDGDEALPDRRMIIHHNWFSNSGTRLPLYRGGHAHIYNNYFQNIETAVNARTGSKLVIENNYFENVGRSIGYWYDDINPSGHWQVSGNIFVQSFNDTPTSSTLQIPFEASYFYQLDQAEDIPALVTAHAGAGRPPLPEE